MSFGGRKSRKLLIEPTPLTRQKLTKSDPNRWTLAMPVHPVPVYNATDAPPVSQLSPGPIPIPRIPPFGPAGFTYNQRHIYEEFRWSLTRCIMALVYDTNGCLLVEVTAMKVVVHLNRYYVRVGERCLSPLTNWRRRSNDSIASKCFRFTTSTAIWLIIAERERPRTSFAVKSTKDLDLDVAVKHPRTYALCQTAKASFCIVACSKRPKGDVLFGWDAAASISVKG